MSQDQLRGKLIPKQTLRGRIHRSAGIDDYEKLRNKPQINGVELSGDLSTEDLGITEPVNADWEAVDGLAKILNKPTIPAAQVNSDWNAVDGVAKILNKPTIPAAQIQSDWNQTDDGEVDYIKNKPTIPAAQVNSDWDATDGVAKILNKPVIYTQNEVDGIIDGLLPVDEADGSVASFSTDLAKPLVSLKADVNAIQDLHGQSGAYPAGGQLWDETWEVGDYDNSGNKRAYNTRIRCKDQIAVSPSTTYCFYMKTASGIAWQFYDTNHDFISQQSRYAGQGGFEFSTPNDCYYMTFGTWDDYGNTYKNDISINSNSTDKSYHPYSNICPIYGWNQVNVTHCGNKYTPNIKPFNEWEIARSDYYISRFSVPNAIITVNLIDKDTTVDLTGVAFGFVDSYWNKNNPITTNEYRWFIQNGTPQTTKKNIAIADASKILTGLIFAPQTEEAYNKLMARYDYEFVFSETSNNEAYNGNTEVINLGDTIYGGYVTQDNNGLKLVVTHKALRLSTLTDWSRITNYTNPFFRATLPTDCKVRTSSSNPQIAICDSYTWFSSNQNYWQYIGNYEFVTAGFGVSYVNRVYIRNDDYTDKDSFITSLSGVYIVYELTTPIEIPLSDIPQLTTLIGTNNIFADSGDVEVKFKKSIQKYIDDKIAETQALIL